MTGHSPISPPSRSSFPSRLFHTAVAVVFVVVFVAVVAGDVAGVVYWMAAVIMVAAVLFAAVNVGPSRPTQCLELVRGPRRWWRGNDTVAAEHECGDDQTWLDPPDAYAYAHIYNMLL